MKIAFTVPINHQNSHMNPIPYGRNTATQRSHGTWHDGSDGTCDQHRSGVNTEATTGGGASAASVAWCWWAENHVGLSETRELSIKFSELAINKGNDASKMIYEHASCV